MISNVSIRFCVLLLKSKLNPKNRLTCKSSDSFLKLCNVRPNLLSIACGICDVRRKIKRGRMQKRLTGKRLLKPKFIQNLATDFTMSYFPSLSHLKTFIHAQYRHYGISFQLPWGFIDSYEHCVWKNSFIFEPQDDNFLVGIIVDSRF